VCKGRDTDRREVDARGIDAALTLITPRSQDMSMSRSSTLPAVACLSAALLLVALPAEAQQVSASNTTDSVAPASIAPAIAAIPRAQRPAVMVMNFEFAAPLAKEDLAELNTLGAAIAAMKSGDATGSAQQTGVNLGKAAADMIVERLLATAQFRVMERKALDEIAREQELAASNRVASGQTVAQGAQLLGARYMITGSITKFGKSQEKKRSGLGMLTKVVAGVDIQSQKTNYEIGITSRIVETSTGEVIASLTTDAVVTGDKGRSIAGLAGTWGGAAGALVGSSNSGEREKRIVESLQHAVDKLVVQYVEVRERGDLVP
jgi:curli biogenesis system outer membrane secretion channel CsgG